MKRLLAVTALLLALRISPAAQRALPGDPLALRDFTLQFDASGTFALSGAGWPALGGTWSASGNEVTLQMAAGPDGCTGTAS